MCDVCEAKASGTYELTKRHPSSLRFHDILYKLGRLHDKKQKDYGTAEDPFNNIRASAREWGMEPWVGAMLRASDKVRRLHKFAATGALANESVIDAFDDLAVYAVIARVMYEEGETCCDMRGEGECCNNTLYLGWGMDNSSD